MTMTDPIADMLTRLRNANVAMHDDVTHAVLQAEGVARRRCSSGRATSRASASPPATDGPGNQLTITLKYSPERDRTISGIKRISKPGLRVYTKAEEIPRVLGGLGVAVLSTNQGLMTDREARKRRVGGEVLCYVW